MLLSGARWEERRRQAAATLQVMASQYFAGLKKRAT